MAQGGQPLVPKALQISLNDPVSDDILSLVERGRTALAFRVAALEGTTR